MATYELYPSGDATGVADTAAIAAKVALLGANDTLWLHGGQWYYLPTANGAWITFTQNGQTLLLGDSNLSWNCIIVGKGSATTTVNGWYINDKTDITIKAFSSKYPATFNGNRAVLAAAGVTTGVLYIVASATVWASANNLVLQDVNLVDGPSGTWLIQSGNTGTITRVNTWCTSAPAGAGHGNDWDAIAYGKPSKNWVITDCILDSYGQECVKHENTTDISYVNCIFLNTVNLVQDNHETYDELNNITFTNCKFYGLVTHLRLKRKGTAVTTISSANLTLSLATAGTGRTATFASAVLAGNASDIGKVIAEVTTNNIGGYSVVTGFTSTTVCTVTNFQAWSNTSISAANVGIASATGLTNNGGGNITYSGCQMLGDGACIWGYDAADGTSNQQQNYGTITITNCTAIDDDGVIGGNQMYLFPSGVTVTASGNIGVSPVRRHYVRPAPPAKVFTASTNGSVSYPCSWNAATVIANAISSTLAAANDEIIVMDGTYNTYDTAPPTNTETISYSNGTGNTIILNAGFALTVRAKHKWKAILDATNSASTARSAIVDASAVTGSKVAGFKVQNFNHGTNNMGFNSLTGANNTEIFQCWFDTITDANGGAGARCIAPSVPHLNECIFTNCSTSATGGGAVYFTSLGMRITNCLFSGNNATGSFGGAVRSDPSATVAADIAQITNCVFVGNTTTTSGNGAGIFGKHFKCTNCTFIGNTGATAGADDIAISNTVPIGGAFTGEFTNCIIYSSTTPLTTSGASGTSKFTNCDIKVANFAAVQALGTGTETDGGGNIYTQDPLFMSATSPFNTRLQSTSSPCYRTGAALAAANNVSWDMDGNPFNVTTPNMGAFSHRVA